MTNAGPRRPMRLLKPKSRRRIYAEQAIAICIAVEWQLTALRRDEGPHTPAVRVAVDGVMPQLAEIRDLVGAAWCATEQIPDEADDAAPRRA